MLQSIHPQMRGKGGERKEVKRGRWEKMQSADTRLLSLTEHCPLPLSSSEEPMSMVTSQEKGLEFSHS